MRLLVVEDNPEMANLLTSVLRDACYAVDRASSGTEAAELVDLEDYDLILLDWEIPEPTGLDLVQTWRRQGLQMPILMLTVRDDVEDRVKGLDAGADDYLAKPFSVSEMLARVRSLLRRRERRLQSRLSAGDLVMDRSRHQVTVGGRPVELSPREFALLEYLLTRKDEVVTRNDIETHVWDASFGSWANVVEVTVHRLRKKIDCGRTDRLLHTVRGAGYVLQRVRS
jgi:DNA-binding response OmpR family regulator